MAAMRASVGPPPQRLLTCSVFQRRVEVCLAVGSRCVVRARGVDAEKETMTDALREARAIQLEASRVGFDWPDTGGAFAKLREEVDELGRSLDSGEHELQHEELGDVLFSVVNVSRFIGADASAALENANRKFSARFGRVCDAVRESGRTLRDCSLAELDAIWERTKREADRGGRSSG